MADDLCMDGWAGVFADLKKLPQPAVPSPTFMVIAGYPQLENVCSNILAFFLDPNREHGFGGLFLNTLLTLMEVPLPQEQEYKNAEVRTEVTTEQRKRLDLVVKTDTFVLGLENKINHDTNNDFREYRRHLDLERGNRRLICVLLSLKKVSPTTAFDEFKPILYCDFFKCVLANMGSALPEAREPYVTFAVDFLKTMIGMSEGKTMDQKVLNFFVTHHSEIHSLAEQTETLRNDMRDKIRKLQQLIRVDNGEPPFQAVQWVYRPKHVVGEDLVHDITRGQGRVLAIDTWILPSGWEIRIWMRKGDFDEMSAWLDRYDIATHMNPQLKQKRRILSAPSLPYNADLPLVQEQLQALLDKVKQAMLKSE